MRGVSVKNYKVIVDMGYKTTVVPIRGESQEEAETYVAERLETDEFLLINTAGRSKVIPAIERRQSEG